jgi:hypothetical protein
MEMAGLITLGLHKERAFLLIKNLEKDFSLQLDTRTLLLCPLNPVALPSDH